MNPVLARRRAGVLLHPTSLPGPGAAGTLGAAAFRFVDFLHAAGFSLWQTLPLGPADRHGSPYCLRSAHAEEPRLIDVARLAEMPEIPRGFAGNFSPERPAELYRAFAAAATPREHAAFAAFVRAERRWLVPYALFRVAERRFGFEPWWQWPQPFRDPEPRKVFAAVKNSKALVRGEMLLQYFVDLQWCALKRYANERGIWFFGDLPMYVDLNGVDVWWHRDLFRLSSDGSPEFVAGVPPDYFNAEGQRWGNPLYDWNRMRERGFVWWRERICDQLRHFDLLRIDHFRALDAYWEIPADATTARAGRWCPGVGDALLLSLTATLGELPLVAEDLGIITDDVRRLRDRFALPGMVVLQFAFDGSADNPHLPRNHRRRAVVYTGTHDNDTTVGWYASQDEATKQRVAAELGLANVRVPDDLIEAAYASVASLAVIPMQDLMGLDATARMNLPGSTDGNWRWRFRWEEIDSAVAETARRRGERYGRAPGAQTSRS